MNNTQTRLRDQRCAACNALGFMVHDHATDSIGCNACGAAAEPTPFVDRVSDFLGGLAESAAPAPVPSTYRLRRYELVAPDLTNAGEPSDYRRAVRAALESAGFTGWTEHGTVGFWCGLLEPGTTFVIYSADWREVPMADNGHAFGREFGERPIERVVRTETLLAELGRQCMPDQAAVQIVRGDVVELIEA